MQADDKDLLRARHRASLPAPPPRRTAQDFDYYLLALTWTPSWCAAEGARGTEQCDPARDLGFTLHGLWPQYEDGLAGVLRPPTARDPSRRETGGDGRHHGLGRARLVPVEQARALHRPFGRPTISRAARQAFDGARPAARAPTGATTAAAVEAAFLAANPVLAPEAVSSPAATGGRRCGSA